LKVKVLIIGVDGAELLEQGLKLLVKRTSEESLLTKKGIANMNLKMFVCWV
jgi:hypothetical protein